MVNLGKSHWFHIFFSAFLIAGCLHFALRSDSIPYSVLLVGMCLIVAALVYRRLWGRHLRD